MHCDSNKTVSLIVLGFNDTSTLVRHFVSSPREKEKREEIVEERRGKEEKGTKLKVKKPEEIKTIPPLPLPATMIAGLANL